MRRREAVGVGERRDDGAVEPRPDHVGEALPGIHAVPESEGVAEEADVDALALGKLEVLADAQRVGPHRHIELPGVPALHESALGRERHTSRFGSAEHA